MLNGTFTAIHTRKNMRRYGTHNKGTNIICTLKLKICLKITYGGGGRELPTLSTVLHTRLKLEK
jgi:hypothetical protein